MDIIGDVREVVNGSKNAPKNPILGKTYSYSKESRNGANDNGINSNGNNAPEEIDLDDDFQNSNSREIDTNNNSVDTSTKTSEVSGTQNDNSTASNSESSSSNMSGSNSPTLSSQESNRNTNTSNDSTNNSNTSTNNSNTPTNASSENSGNSQSTNKQNTEDSNQTGLNIDNNSTANNQAPQNDSAIEQSSIIEDDNFFSSLKDKITSQLSKLITVIRDGFYIIIKCETIITGAETEFVINERDFKTFLKEMGFSDDDIQDVLDGKKTPDDILNDIQVKENTDARRKILEQQFLELFKGKGVNCSSMEELNSKITKITEELKELRIKLAKNETDLQELELKALNDLYLKLSSDYYVNLEDFLDQVIVWKYTDENGITHYETRNPSSFETSDITKYKEVTYKELLENSEIYNLLKSELNIDDKGLASFKNPDSQTIIINKINELNNEVKNKSIEKNRIIDELKSKIEVAEQEYYLMKSIRDYIKSELDYYFANIDPYIYKSDFLKNCEYIPEDIILNENAKIHSNDNDYTYELTVTGREEIAKILISMLNEGQVGSQGTVRSGQIADEYGNRMIIAGTDGKDDIINNFATWKDQISDDEKRIATYIYNTEGASAAYEYLMRISSKIDERWLIDKQSKDENWSKENEFLASLGSVFVTPIEGMAAMAYSLHCYVTEQKMRYYGVYSSGDTWRSSVAKEILESFQNQNAGKVWSFLYSTGMSMVDSLQLIGLTFLTGGAGVGLSTAAKASNIGLTFALMGTRAYVSTINDCLSRGMSDNQAILIAWASALTETAMEYKSLTHLLNLETKVERILKNATKNIPNLISNEKVAHAATKLFYVLASSASQGIAEADEEFCTEVINYLSEIVIGKDLSKYALSLEHYLSIGYSEDDAVTQTLKDFSDQITEAYLGGLLSGMCFGAFSGEKSTIYTSYGLSHGLYGEKVSGNKAQQLAQAYEINQQQLSDMEDISKTKDISKLTPEQLELLRKGTIEQQATEQIKEGISNAFNNLAKSISNVLNSNIPQEIKRKIRTGHLSFEEYIQYNLEEKVSIDCLDKTEKSIVERFGIEKSKTLDWELINNNKYNDEVINLLLNIDINSEDINSILYDLIKDKIPPKNYSTKMKEAYPDRVFNKEELSKIEEYYNLGMLDLNTIIENWDLLKDKQLDLCLENDYNSIGITDEMLKGFMSQYSELAVLLINNNIDLYSFIREISKLDTQEEQHEFIKEYADRILYQKDYNGNIIKLTNEEYRELFKYSSIREYIKHFNYDNEPIELFKELDSLPEDYLYNMPFPISAICDYYVIFFLNTYGLQNIVDFDNECGHFFSANNCEMLSLMFEMYLHYGGNQQDPNKIIYTKRIYDENGNYNNNPYTKDEFYEAMKRMILYGPTNFSYSDKAPDYRNMTGEFRSRNPELFISEEAPESLKKLFYAQQLTPELLVLFPEYIPYLKGKNLSACFKSLSLHINNSTSAYGYENLYSFLSTKMDFDTLMSFITKNYIELEVVFNTSKGLYGTPLSYDFFNNDDSYEQILSKFEVLYQCSVEYYKIQDPKLQQIFKEYINNNKAKINKETVHYISETLQRIAKSNSIEISAFRNEIASQVLETDNPLETLSKIEYIFTKNSIPTIGKIYACFELLHPDFKGFDFDNDKVSPILKKASLKAKKLIVFADLIRAAFGSNNRSINNYLKNIKKGSELYRSIKKNNSSYESLSEIDKTELISFRDHLATLYNNTLKGKQENNSFNTTNDAIADINELVLLLSPDGSTDYDIADRIIRMFCGSVGLSTIEQAQEYIRLKVEIADKRNREAAKKKVQLSVGDFVKGIGNIDYLRNLLQNGIVSKEYLGSSATSDATPLDTDLSMILTEGNIREQLAKTAANGYGPIWFVLKNDKRFTTTRTIDGETGVARDLNKHEVFYTGVLGKDHYGIRTGFASSDIDYILVSEYDSRIGLEIAMNGFYIPVIDFEGNILFTPEDYDALRRKMSGLDYYGLSDYNLSENLFFPEIEEIKKKIRIDINNTNSSNNKITNLIKNAIIKSGISKIINGFSNDLTNGTCEFYSTGSTARSTNVPNDSDFDYLIKIDREIFFDPIKLEEFKNKMKEELGFVEGFGGKICGTIIIDGKEQDVEISICPRTDKVEFSTDTALSSMLESIKEQYPDSYESVIANIVFAKEFFKSINAYKSLKSDSSQGGLGGIGIEYWILQHGGSFVDAARSFVENAHKAGTFEEFCNIYQVFDFGKNHYSEKTTYPHDNFVGGEGKMGERAYHEILHALEKYLENLE